ncbi:hypothetical protein HZS_2111 [Henneguya salminicola]|nr:hypothetical protein HZS_2111 [Henneguya salminicola]
MKYRFQEMNSFEERSTESMKILAEYPDRIPIIVEPAPRSTIKKIDRSKFLVPREFTVSQFICLLRKRMSVSEFEALFLSVDKILPPLNHTLDSIYSKFKNKDGFLYMSYSGEDVYGWTRKF